jgi:hypothetical protein
MIKYLQKKLKKITEKRPPDYVIGQRGDPYLQRWFIFKLDKAVHPNGDAKHLHEMTLWEKFIHLALPKLYIHKFLKDDYDEAMHNHPARSISFLFHGQYKEFTEKREPKVFSAPAIIFRNATDYHRVELIDSEPAYTLFFFLPRIKYRIWKFNCPKGPINWFDFVDQHNNGNTGKGCPE